MPRAILLNDDFDTVKRLWLHPEDGSATLQHFTRTGCAEFPLTAEELELVRTSAYVMENGDADDVMTHEAERWELPPLPYRTAHSNGFHDEESPDAHP